MFFHDLARLRCPGRRTAAHCCREMGAPARAARRRCARRSKRCARRQGRLVAAGRGRDRGRGEPTTTLLASLGDDLRFLLLTSAARVQRASEPQANVTGERASEVRALLALPRRRQRRGACAAAARRTCAAPARSAGMSSAWRWFALAAAIVVADQLAKWAVLGLLRRPRAARGNHGLLQPGAGLQQGRGVQLPRRRARLADAAVHRLRACRGGPVRHADRAQSAASGCSAPASR